MPTKPTTLEELTGVELLEAARLAVSEDPARPVTWQVFAEKYLVRTVNAVHKWRQARNPVPMPPVVVNKLRELVAEHTTLRRSA